MEVKRGGRGWIWQCQDRLSDRSLSTVSICRGLHGRWMLERLRIAWGGGLVEDTSVDTNPPTLLPENAVELETA